VGHFDLIRLFSKNPNGTFQQWEGVWSRITRNLHFVAEYNGLLELNSSALRKGMTEPYPKIEICEVSIGHSTQHRLELTQRSDVSHNGWWFCSF